MTIHSGHWQRQMQNLKKIKWRWGALRRWQGLTVTARYHQDLKNPPIRVTHRMSSSKFGPSHLALEGSGPADATPMPSLSVHSMLPCLLLTSASLILKLLWSGSALPSQLLSPLLLHALAQIPLLRAQACNQHLRPQATTPASFLQILGLRISDLPDSAPSLAALCAAIVPSDSVGR